MSITITELAKKLNITVEAVKIHTRNLEFEIPDNEILPENIVNQINKIEIGDEITQIEHEFEEKFDREIIENQQKVMAGNKKTEHKKKNKKKNEESLYEKDGFIILPENMTVRELSNKIKKSILIILIRLKKNGIVANVKQEIDYETAAIVCEELEIKVKKEELELSGEDLFRGNLEDLLTDEDREHQIKRPPVVSVMGHVDHGKTSILDYIRKSKVAEKEAGGITQRIGAYQIHFEDYPITFLDTPGHEAFTLMRARGARATDIAVLVVAATEGLKPQSIEAINHAKEANIPIVVAINKMDLDGANPELVKTQLAEQEVTPEDWGGDVPCLEVSAKSGIGIDKLLETIHLIAELRELQTNPDRKAIGTVLESTMDTKVGISATILINTGTLQKGDSFVVYDQAGKVKVMYDFKGLPIHKAGPSDAVKIWGFSMQPKAGDLFQVVENDKIARQKSEEVASLSHVEDLKNRKKLSLATIKTRIREGKMKQLKVIVKAESRGTLEAIISEIQKLKTEKSFAKVIHSGVGEITESDAMLAQAGNAILVGFSIVVSSRIKKIIDQEDINLLQDDVIYRLTEEIMKILEGQAIDEEEEKIVGEFLVKKIFATNKKMAVLGGEVLSGKIRGKTYTRQFRIEKAKNKDETDQKKLLGTFKIDTVQRGADTVNEISAVGLECGLKISHSNLIFEESDLLELFLRKK